MVWILSWSFMVTITVVASRWTFVVTVLHRRAEKMYQTIKSTWPEVCFTNQCHVHIAPDEFLTGWKFWQDTSFTREQNRNNKRTEIERFGWFIERIQTRVAFGWLSETRVKKRHAQNFLEINRYFALTSHCNSIEQSNNAFSMLGFSLAGKRRVHVFIFSSIGW